MANSCLNAGTAGAISVMAIVGKETIAPNNRLEGRREEITKDEDAIK